MTPTIWHRVKAMLGSKPGPVGHLPQDRSPQLPPHTDNSTSTVDSLRRPKLPELHRQATRSMALGQIVAGRFEILRFINSGGMGEVYEAWDSLLRERVALKALRRDTGFSPSVIERFKREVKQARVISHVNVCRVYEVFSHTQPSGEQVWFLTMELLEGETLSRRLWRRGPLPADEAIELIEQMVAGLAAAHDLDVVHRDFKSSNVMLVKTKAGRTRLAITDFGLALNVLTEPSGRLEASSVGTPQYMAPEQERGGEVGFATDQYALGVVMCEMLTGQRPSRPDSTGKVQWPSAGLNPRLEAIIRRCLELRPEDRFKDIRDILSELNLRRRPRTRTMGIAAALTLTVMAALLWRFAGDAWRVEDISQLTPDTDLTSRPSLSRDGKLIAYSSDRADPGKRSIWVQRLPSGRPIRLTNGPAQDVDPNIAPDGSLVAFRSERDGGGIYLTKVTGAGERLLAPGGRDPRFSPDSRSVLYWAGDRDDTVGSGRIFIASISDGSSVRIAADFKDARLPVWSSDGQYILFTGCRSGDQPLPGCLEWWAASRDGTRVQNTGSLALLRERQIQVTDEIGGWYRDTVLFSGKRGSKTSLWKLVIPLASLKVQGQPTQLTSGDAREVAPSLADNDTIAFEHLTAALHIWRIALSDSSATKVTQDAAADLTPSISQGGRWLVFSRGVSSPHDIWIKDIQSGGESLFLASAQDKFWPIIDGAGETVVFERRDGGAPSVFAATRGQPPRLLCNACSNPTSWFKEDRAVFYRVGLPSKIEMGDLLTGQSEVVLEADGYSLGEASWSPQTEYLLFTASRTGDTKQVFAVLYPQTAQSPVGEWIPITSDAEFSDRPRWASDGKTVFYLSNRDGFSCVWGQRFDRASPKSMSRPFALMHYHNPRFSPDVVVNRSFNLSVSKDSVFLNVGEINTSVWTGVLKHRTLAPPWKGRR